MGGYGHRWLEKRSAYDLKASEENAVLAFLLQIVRKDESIGLGNHAPACHTAR